MFLLYALLAVDCGGTLAQDAASYRVHAGDVIEVDVAGAPELHGRSSVQLDGVVAFPLLGAVQVEGQTPAEMRLTIQNRLSQKIYRRRSVDGREFSTIIRSDEVSAAVVEYRPVYVSGDVAKQGALVYRSGLNARQAIVLAGGVDIAALRSVDPAFELAAVRAEAQSDCLEIVKAQARVARIDAELAGGSTLSGHDPACPALTQAQAAQIQKGANDVMQARMLDYHRQQDYLRAAFGQLNERSAILEKQQQSEEQGARADEEDLRNMLDLLKRGNVANPRVLEARRALLLSQTRALQVSDGLLQIKRQAGDFARQLQHLDDDRKAELLQEREEAAASVEKFKAKFEAEQNKLRLLTLSRSRLTPDEETQTVIRLVREVAGRSAVRTINSDFQLEPGDVLQIAVKTPQD